MSEHDRFEELASLAAIGELSREEYEEFLRHKETCPQCRAIVADTTSVATAAFLAGSPKNADPADQTERHRRLGDNIARRLPLVVRVPVLSRHKRLIAAGIAAAFVLGTGVGGAVGLRKGRGTQFTKNAVKVPPTTTVPVVEPPVSEQTEPSHFQVVVDNLRKEIDHARGESRALRDKLVASDQHAAELESRLDEVEKRSAARAEEVAQARNELSAARSELSQAKESFSASQGTIQALQYKLSDREARLTEVTASVDRERDLQSAKTEMGDLIAARNLHIVDVYDADPNGKQQRSFGRVFYIEGKSLVFYAYDLEDPGRFKANVVFHVWGGKAGVKEVTHSLGILRKDDAGQSRWAMTFDDPKVLAQINSVFVTAESANRHYNEPHGKKVLYAYFGSQPNHP